ncbi:hypothetical protein [Singulisphaera sp. PoT]|uniref:hypothetical protein n=1 Tax=Singulisphaera sp. PoT TaxID=3411797 RepID=UPI003BF52FA9
MLRDFRQLLMVAPGEGAIATVRAAENQSQGEVDELLSAWSQERQVRIETSLYLERAQKLLVHILSDGAVTAATRKKALRLLIAIDESSQRDEGSTS